MSEKQWYYYVDDKVQGPKTEDEIRTMITYGTLNLDSLVWDGAPEDGLRGWIKIEESGINLKPSGIRFRRSPSIFSAITTLWFVFGVFGTIGARTAVIGLGWGAPGLQGTFLIFCKILLSGLIDLLACFFPGTILRFPILKKPVKRKWLAAVIAIFLLTPLSFFISVVIRVITGAETRYGIDVILIAMTSFLILISNDPPSSAVES